MPALAFQWFGPATAVLTVNAAITTAGTFTTTNLDTANLNADFAASSISGDASLVNVAAPGQIQDGIDLSASGAMVNVATGTYTGNVSTAGKAIALSPGATSPGRVAINGNLTLDGDDTLVMDVNGSATPGTDYDQLVVNGTVALGGGHARPQRDDRLRRGPESRAHRQTTAPTPSPAPLAA